MITHHVDIENHIIEITIAGKVNRQELSGAMADIEGPLKEWPEIRVLKRVDSFSGMELMALWDDLKFVFENWDHYKKIKKIAVVTDKEWIEKISGVVGGLAPGEVRVFEGDEIEKARDWLK